MIKLTEFELDIMRVFWSNDRISSSEAAKIICEEKGVAVTTVKSVISKLEEKGALKVVGQRKKAYVYMPLVSPQEISNTLIPKLLRRLFDNSPRKLITNVIEKHDLNEGDIEHIEKMLQQCKESMKRK